LFKILPQRHRDTEIFLRDSVSLWLTRCRWTINSVRFYQYNDGNQTDILTL